MTLRRFQTVWQWSKHPILHEIGKRGCIGLNRWGACLIVAHSHFASSDWSIAAVPGDEPGQVHDAQVMRRWIA